MSTALLLAQGEVVARAIHILAVVAWIGSIWLVTTLLLPRMRQMPPEQWRREFDAIERGFAPQARLLVLLVLLTGLYMLYADDLWDRFEQSAFWWMHLMVGVWLLFASLLFVIEPLVVRHAVHRGAAHSPRRTLTRMIRLHRVMLGLALAAIFAAVAGSHGLF